MYKRVFGTMMTAAVCAAMTLPLHAAEEEEASEPTLVVGDDAPALPDIPAEHWVKGEPIEGFEDGQVYLVEFWATWCGPCIAAMPHLTSLQEEYGEDLVVLGLTKPDRNNTLEGVKAKLEELGDRVGYRMAFDADSEAFERFMVAAEQNGIPCSFVIDAQGKVAYIGHPNSIDETLEAVIKGEHDLEEAAKKYANRAEQARALTELSAAYNKAYEEDRYEEALEYADRLAELPSPQQGWHKVYGVICLFRLERPDEAMERATKLRTNDLNKQASELSLLGSVVVAMHPEKDDGTLRFAAGCVEEAIELVPNNNLILSRYARVKAAQGNREEALEIMDKVIAHTPESQMRDIYIRIRNEIAAEDLNEGKTTDG